MSLLGGAGFNTLNNLTPATMQAIQSAIDSALQTSRFQQGQSEENRRQKERIKAQEDAQKKAEKAQKKAMWTSLGIGAGAGLATAGLGAALAPTAAAAPLAAGTAPGLAEGSVTASTIADAAIAAPTAEIGAGIVDAGAAQLAAAPVAAGAAGGGLGMAGPAVAGGLAGGGAYTASAQPSSIGQNNFFHRQGNPYGGLGIPQSADQLAAMGGYGIRTGGDRMKLFGLMAGQNIANVFAPGAGNSLNAVLGSPQYNYNAALGTGLTFANLGLQAERLATTQRIAEQNEYGRNQRALLGAGVSMTNQELRNQAAMDRLMIGEGGRDYRQQQGFQYGAQQNQLNRDLRQGLFEQSEAGRMGRHYDTMGLRREMFNEGQAATQNRFDAAQGFRQSDADRRYELSRQGLQLQQQREGRLGQPGLGDLTRTLGVLEPWGYDPADPTSPMSTELYNQIQGRIMPQQGAPAQAAPPASDDPQGQYLRGEIDEAEFRRRRGY